MPLETVMSWVPLVAELTADCAPPITPAVILAVIYLESKGDAGAINSRSGAAGLMQVMPREANPALFADRPTQEELLDPETNIAWGIRVLRWSLRGDRSLKQALYHYSGGHTWQDEQRYERLYWRTFQKYRRDVTRALGGL